jgi:hypothetical protein
MPDLVQSNIWHWRHLGKARTSTKSIVGRRAGNEYPIKRAKFDPRTNHKANMNGGQLHKQLACHGNMTDVAEIADGSRWTSRQNMIALSRHLARNATIGMALPFNFRWRKGQWFCPNQC